MYSAYSAVNCGYGEGMFISQNPLKRDLSNHLEVVLWQIILFTIDQFDTPKKRPKSPLNFCYAGDVTQNLASSYPKIIMLKAIQILGSSSGFVSCRFRKGQPNSGLSLISIPSRKPIGTTYKTDSLLLLLPASQVHNHKGRCCCFRDFRMLSTHSKSNPEGASSSSSSSSSIQSTILQGNIRKINFCQFCGGPTKHEIPDGEEKVRAICTRCGKITYENPKMVVGCLIEHGKKILMCRRKIHPSFGLWTLPAGYMEIGESAAEGAIRETWEEANAEVEVQSPFAQLDIPLIGQTYMIFLAKLKNPHFSPGPESSECQLFELDDIPFDSLAFSSMLVTLKLYIEDIKVGRPKFHYGIINKRPGTSPSDIHAYTLDFHMQS